VSAVVLEIARAIPARNRRARASNVRCWCSVDARFAVGAYFPLPALDNKRAKAVAAGDKLRPERLTMASVRLIAGCSSLMPTTAAAGRVAEGVIEAGDTNIRFID